MRVLITQSAQDARTSAAALEARGHQVLTAPLVTAERPDVPKINLAGAQGFLVTSADGARALADNVGVRTFPVFADSEMTASSLRRFGFKHVEAAKDDAADLARLVERKITPAGGALIYACSTAAPINLSAMLSNMGFAVRPWPLYTLKRAEQMPEIVRAALRNRTLDAALFLSADEARAFVALVQRDELEALVRELPCIAASPVVAAPLRALKLGGVSVPQGADLDTVFGALDMKLVDRVEEERAAREARAREEAERQRLETERQAKERAERERLAREQLEKERAEKERLAAEQAAREQAARYRAEQEHIAREQAEREKAERKRLEQEKAEREREARRLAEQERLAQEKAAKERAAQERAERERVERERLTAEKAERERIAAEKAAAEKTERERIAKERAEQERLERERLAAEKAERERLMREQREREEQIAREQREREERAAKKRAEQERLERERLAKEKTERDRIAAEKAAAEKAERERIAQERAEHERLERTRLAAERAERERIAAEQIAQARSEQERLALEAAERQRRERDRLAAEQAEHDRMARENAEAERARRETAAREQAERDRVEHERLAREQREREEQIMRDQREREEQIVRERREREEQIAAEKAERDRLAREQRERDEQAAREKAEAERLARAERERAQREQAAKEKAERERLLREQAERNRIAAEKAATEKAERDRIARERVEAERAERARLAQEQAERERLAREQREREEQIMREQREREEQTKREQREREEQIMREQREREEQAKREQREREEQTRREQRAQEKAAQARIAGERAAAEKAEKAEKKRIAAAYAAHVKQEKTLAAEKKAAEKAERRRAEQARKQQATAGGAPSGASTSVGLGAFLMGWLGRRAAPTIDNPGPTWGMGPGIAPDRAPTAAPSIGVAPERSSATIAPPAAAPPLIVKDLNPELPKPEFQTPAIENPEIRTPEINTAPPPAKEEQNVPENSPPMADDIAAEKPAADPSEPVADSKPVLRGGGRAARLLAEDAADMRAKDQRFKYLGHSEAPAPEPEAAERSSPSAGFTSTQSPPYDSKSRSSAARVAVLFVILAGVAATVMGTASWWVPRVTALVNGAPTSSTAATETASPLQADINALKARLSVLEQQAGNAATMENLNAAKQELAQRLVALEARGKGQDGEAVTSLGDSLSSQAKQLTAVSARIATLEAAIGNSARLEDLSKRLNMLEGRSAEANSVLALSDRVTSLETNARRTMVEQSTNIALLMAVAQWREAVLAGHPFALELQTAKALASRAASMTIDDSGFAAAAAQGIPTLPELQRRFSATAAAAMRADTIPDDTAAWYRRILDRMLSIVTVRRLDGDAAGTSVSAILARAQRRLTEGDLGAAVAEMNGLSGSAATAVESWLTLAKTRVAAEHAAAEATIKSVAILAGTGTANPLDQPAPAANGK